MTPRVKCRPFKTATGKGSAAAPLTPRLRVALAKVRDLFVKAPRVQLTTAETARASGLDRQVCRVLLRNLAEVGFIERRESGVFVRRPSRPDGR